MMGTLMRGSLTFWGITHMNSPSDKGNRSPLERVLEPTAQSQVLKIVIIGTAITKSEEKANDHIPDSYQHSG